MNFDITFEHAWSQPPIDKAQRIQELLTAKLGLVEVPKEFDNDYFSYYHVTRDLKGNPIPLTDTTNFYTTLNDDDIGEKSGMKCVLNN